MISSLHPNILPCPASFLPGQLRNEQRSSGSGIPRSISYCPRCAANCSALTMRAPVDAQAPCLPWPLGRGSRSSASLCHHVSSPGWLPCLTSRQPWFCPPGQPKRDEVMLALPSGDEVSEAGLQRCGLGIRWYCLSPLWRVCSSTIGTTFVPFPNQRERVTLTSALLTIAARHIYSTVSHSTIHSQPASQ